jgi:hypothetical protein
LHLRDQIVPHEQGVPREIADEKMKGDQSLVDLMMAWMMKAVQKMMKGAKKGDRQMVALVDHYYVDALP